ncbi:MAG: type II secretion system protein, partial [Planctomycetota bacterium]|nr:type II secretion system protein [Planctomycetota bacterium]
MANDRTSTESAGSSRIGGARNGAAAGSPAPGFTVVELLVVLAIVVILATLLAPAYNGARTESIAVSCGSNLHHIGVGFGAFRAQRPVKDAGDTRGSGPYPPSDFWPGIPGTMIADWNLFVCPAETKLATNSSVLEFHSQEGWSVPFGPSDCCQVHVGPGPAWGGGSDYPPTPVGATDYGFEDIGGPGSSSHGDADFNDAVIRIYDGADEAFLIAGSAGYSNSIWSNGKLLYQIPSIFGRVNPPVRFQLPEGKTNYGY